MVKYTDFINLSQRKAFSTIALEGVLEATIVIKHLRELVWKMESFVMAHSVGLQPMTLPLLLWSL